MLVPALCGRVLGFPTTGFQGNALPTVNARLWIPLTCCLRATPAHLDRFVRAYGTTDMGTQVHLGRAFGELVSPDPLTGKGAAPSDGLSRPFTERAPPRC